MTLICLMFVLIFNGAEPISANLCQQFTEELKQFGLSKLSMFPVYGLAEACLAVSFPKINAELEVAQIQRDSLSIGDPVEFKDETEASVLLVGVGAPIKNCKVRISDKEGNELPEKSVGHIHIGGGNVTEQIIGDDGSIFYEGGWVDTGDLGFVFEENLFITGRYKEILFVNGQNFYPYDIEDSFTTTS